MIISILIYILVFTIITCKAFYTSTPLIKSFSVRKNIEIFSVSIKIESIPFFFNIGKINLFSILFMILLLIFFFLIDLINNNTTYCAGVPKLVELANDGNLNYHKTLFKYNFSLLNKNNNFYSDRLTIIELNKICSEINLLHSSIINDLILIKKDILSMNTQKDSTEMINNINFSYNENSFIRENLRLVNKKLGIPLYVDLYNKTFYPDFPIYLLKKSFNEDLIRNIHTFLTHEKLSKNVNYFNLDLRIDGLGNLIVLQQDFTVDATTDIGEKVTDRVGRNRQIIGTDKVFSTVVLDNGELCNVMDTRVLPEVQNGAEIPEILVGGVGIIETYFYYFKCMDKTVSLLDYSILKLTDIRDLLSKPYLKDALIQKLSDIPNNFDLYNMNESRIIDEKIIPDARKVLIEDGTVLNKNILLKINKIDSIFIEQLKRDSSMLKDIHNQQSGMHVNYSELIKIIENPENKNSFNPNIKDKILRAAEGDFSLKRSRF